MSNFIRPLYGLNFNFVHIKPACVLWCIVPFNLVSDGASLLLSKRFKDCLLAVDIQIIRDKDDCFRVNGKLKCHTFMGNKNVILLLVDEEQPLCAYACAKGDSLRGCWCVFSFSYWLLLQGSPMAVFGLSEVVEAEVGN